MAKEREITKKHNQYRVEEGARDALKRFTVRIEKLADEKDAIADDMKEEYAQMKSLGFDTAALRRIVADRRKRRKDPEKFDDTNDMVDLYMDVIGFE